MAITNYSELQTAIGNWIHRSDLTAVIPDFIEIFEATANKDPEFRTRHNYASTDLTTTGGTATVTLPTDFLEARSAILSVNPKQVLQPKSPDGLLSTYPNSDSGEPRAYTIQGTSLRLGPIPDGTYTIELLYYQKITALSDTDTTNWLITNHPDVYLFGSLVAGQAYVGSDKRYAIWERAYANAKSLMGHADDRAQYGGQPLQAQVRDTA